MSARRREGSWTRCPASRHPCKPTHGSAATRPSTWERFRSFGSLGHLVKERPHTDAEHVYDPVEQIHGDVDILALQLAQVTSINATRLGQATLRQAAFRP